MSEYDAFGRKKDQNPLEELGTAPAGPPTVAAPAAPARSGRPRVFVVMLVAAGLFVMASVGLSVALLAGGETEGGLTEPAVVSEGEGGAPVADPGATSSPAPVPTPAPALRDPRGLGGRSLLRRNALARVVKALRTARLGRPVSLRVAPARIDVQLKTAGGRLRNVQVGPSGAPREISLSGSGFGHVDTLAWRVIDPRAPERLLRAAAERARRPAADVDYLVLLDLGQPTWGLFFKGGMHFQGDAAGRITRRVSP